jgi:hypothetical protein
MDIFDGDDDHEGGNCVWPSQCEEAGRKRLASGPMPVAVPKSRLPRSSGCVLRWRAWLVCQRRARKLPMLPLA